jgi:uncharacterized membrane protein YcaP (DUF421 family)
MSVDLLAMAEQGGLAIIYYAGVVLMVRLAGKRLAGPVATFDLIILIGMAVDSPSLSATSC